MPKRTKTIGRPKKGNTAKAKRSTGGLTLGLKGFSKISAVEGITMRSSTRKMFADFDRRGLSPAERRRAIFEKHAKKA